MFTSKLFVPMAIALGLALGAPAVAAEPHAHGDATTAVQLRLDHGKKWQARQTVSPYRHQLLAAAIV